MLARPVELNADGSPTTIPSGLVYRKRKIPKDLRQAVFDRDGRQCVRCSCENDLTVDHIDPEVNGGRATLENLQTLCRSCNSRKGAR